LTQGSKPQTPPISRRAVTAAASSLCSAFRRQVAGLFDAIEIQAAGCELRDLPAASRGQRDVENLGAHQAPRGAFVHGEVVAAQPVPTLEVVDAVDTNFDLQLRLSPEAGAVRRKQSDSGIEVGELELPVAAIQIHSGPVAGVFLEIVVGLELKAHFVRARLLSVEANSSHLPPALTRRIRPGSETWRPSGRRRMPPRLTQEIKERLLPPFRNRLLDPASAMLSRSPPEITLYIVLNPEG